MAIKEVYKDVLSSAFGKKCVGDNIQLKVDLYYLSEFPIKSCKLTVVLKECSARISQSFC